MTTAATKQPTGDFERLLEYIRSERGFDFTGYKRPSLTRRIDKRLQEERFDDYDGYRKHLGAHPEEFIELFNTILINVTSFFRDETTWDFLRTEIVPRIADTRAGQTIRIWSTGCATGEEAYSLAMAFAEGLGEGSFRHRVKIYATDIDDDALNYGRHASYTLKQIEPVPHEFRERYFEQTNTSFIFRKDLRRAVIFGRHDLVRDPPISKIDLLVSRNTLMYFDASTQQQVLTNFHFALRDDGYLFLGKSEALAARSNLFAPIDLKRRVFAKVPRVTRQMPRIDLELQPAQSLPQLASQTLIRDAGFEAVPAAQLVVDREGALSLANLQARIFFGLTQRDIGRAFKDLEVSFRPVELRSRIEQAMTERHVISLREVEWPVGSDIRFVDVQVAPLIASNGETVGAGITFTEVTRYRRLQEALQESKRESETAYEELQSTVEELETTNEELQSTNEELETTNEELQSTNEELETMNEELQSTNEELETMNTELADRSLELNETNAFLDTVLASLDAGVIALNEELQVEAWNRGARDLWGLTQDETVGQHFLNLDIGLPVAQLSKPIREALSDGSGDGSKHLRLGAVNRRGKEIAVLVSLTPLLSPAGKKRGVILMMQTSGDTS
jgi:two-component system, chemotaxis family, CheB/CheR fusion protein